jgi:hypothetical protein
MTQTQSDQLERALGRAIARGIYIVGKGTMRYTSHVVYVVSSSTRTSCHLVILSSGRLHCDCAGAAHGRICQHRAMVHARLLSERQIAQQAKTAATPISASRESMTTRMRPFSLMA